MNADKLFVFHQRLSAFISGHPYFGLFTAISSAFG